MIALKDNFVRIGKGQDACPAALILDLKPVTAVGRQQISADREHFLVRIKKILLQAYPGTVVL